MLTNERGPVLATAAGAPIAGQESLREHNLAVVFGALLATPGDTPSRAELAQRTGLARATVSAIVAQLIELGLVVEGPAPVARGVGRPSVPLAPAGRTIVGLGLEVNVDYLGLRAIDLTQTVIEEWVEEGDFRGSDPDEILGRLFAKACSSVARLSREGVRVAGAALALPGIADHPQGPLRLAPNLGWQDTDVLGIAEATVAKARGAAALRPALRQALVEGLTVGNEAKLAAHAEALGSADDAQSFIYLSGQVGVGAAIVIDGEIFRGLHGWSGEIGHIIVEPGGRLCACGARGCLERYAGTAAVMTAAGFPADGSFEAVVALLDDPGPDGERCRAAVAAAGQALGSALAGAINLLDIPATVIGGHLWPLAEVLAPAIMAEMEGRVLSARWTAGEFSVRPAAAGRYAALVGGALQSLGRVTANPAVLLD